MQILIADDGIGIRASLAENSKYRDIDEASALRMCLQDKITDGKGMGFGLYTTSRLIDSIGEKFVLHSGNHKLVIKNGQAAVEENGLWQGTLIYMEIGTAMEIDPNQVVDHRADERIAKLHLEIWKCRWTNKKTTKKLAGFEENSYLCTRSEE